MLHAFWMARSCQMDGIHQENEWNLTEILMEFGTQEWIKVFYINKTKLQKCVCVFFFISSLLFRDIESDNG